MGLSIIFGFLNRSYSLFCTCKKGILFLGIVLFSSSFIYTQEVSWMEEAEYWYNMRSDSYRGHKVNHQNIDKAIYFYTKELHTSQSHYITERLLACYHFKVSYADLDDKEIKLLTEKAVDFGESAIREYPESAPILYWHASLLSKWAEYHGIFLANSEEIPDRIRQLSEKVIKLAPDYRWSGGYRILGLLHCMTPRIPFLFDWVSKDLAFLCLEKAANKNPEHLGNLLGLAKIYKKKNMRKEADLLLQKISDTVPRESLLMEDLMIIHRANEMLDESYNCGNCFKYTKHDK